MTNLRIFLFTLIIAGGFGLTPVFAVADARFAADPALSGWSTAKDDIEELLKSAQELYGQKKYDEALALCAKAAELNPNDFRPHALAGFIFSAQLKFKSASESFAKAIALKPDYKSLYVRKANADWLRGAKDEAIATCRELLEIDPGFAQAYLMIGNILRHDPKRREEAIAAFRSAIKADPSMLSTYESLGEIYTETNDEKSAEEMYRKAMEIDPAHMAGRFLLGRLFVEKGRLKEARALWEGRTSDDDNTFPNFITVLERAEKLKAATDALAKKPNDPASLVLMGNAVMDGDHWVVDDRQESAIEYFKKALKINPRFAPAQYGIVKAYIELADTSKDINKNVDEELAKLRKLDPKLAKEMEEYRKTYSGGLLLAPVNENQ